MEDQRKRVKDLSRLMDSDSDGFLDYQEAKVAFRVLGLPAKKSFVVSTIRMYDKRGCNKISLDDFCYVALDKLSKRSALDEAKHAFKLLCSESLNGNISVETLRRINERFDCDLTTEEMDRMIQEFDLDRDGFIDEAEFLEMMTGGQ